MGKFPVLSIIILLSFTDLASSAPGSSVSGENLTEICSRAIYPTFLWSPSSQTLERPPPDLHGLANISVSLATSNTTAALGLVESLAKQEADPVLKGRYAQCTTWYEEEVKELEKAGWSVESGDFGGMGEHASIALEKSEVCSDAIALPPPEPSRLTESNRNVQHLCNVMYVTAVAIVG